MLRRTVTFNAFAHESVPGVRVGKTLVVTLLVAVCLANADRASATFPGANGRLVVSLNGDIVVMNPDGSGEVALTSTGGDYWPSWSPDGTRIAFVRYSPTRTSIWVMD